MVEKTFKILPKHVAIVMDGNGRWAKSKKIIRIKGHQHGINAVKRVVDAALDLNIRYLTLFAFSSENWNRPLSEINGLINLMRSYLKGEVSKLHKKEVKLNFIGGIDRFPSDIVKLLYTAKKETIKNSKLILTIALNYGSRVEITNACKKISYLVKNNEININDIDEAFFSNFLETSGIPDPDLLIRTSGEKRISNFLLWQLSYSELVFLDVLWPDFTKDDLIYSIQEYNTRHRRFGKIA